MHEFHCNIGIVLYIACCAMSPYTPCLCTSIQPSESLFSLTFVQFTSYFYFCALFCCCGKHCVYIYIYLFIYLFIFIYCRWAMFLLLHLSVTEVDSSLITVHIHLMLFLYQQSCRLSATTTGRIC